MTKGAGHSQEWQDGRRNGIKLAIEWLHNRAGEMNDPHAKAILDCAAFNLGNAAKRKAEKQKQEQAA